MLILLILHLLAPPGWAERALAGGHQPMPPPETEPSFGLTDGEVTVLAEHLRTLTSSGIHRHEIHEFAFEGDGLADWRTEIDVILGFVFGGWWDPQHGPWLEPLADDGEGGLLLSHPTSTAEPITAQVVAEDVARLDDPEWIEEADYPAEFVSLMRGGIDRLIRLDLEATIPDGITVPLTLLALEMHDGRRLLVPITLTRGAGELNWWRASKCIVFSAALAATLLACILCVAQCAPSPATCMPCVLGACCAVPDMVAILLSVCGERSIPTSVVITIGIINSICAVTPSGLARTLMERILKALRTLARTLRGEADVFEGPP